MHLTPGIHFLAAGAVYCSIPAIGAVAVQNLAVRIYNIHIPTWAVALGSFMTLPLAVYVRIFQKGWKDRRDAAAVGAQIVPKVKGHKFGNLDILRIMTEVWESGYPGACQCHK